MTITEKAFNVLRTFQRKLDRFHYLLEFDEQTIQVSSGRNELSCKIFFNRSMTITSTIQLM